MDKKVISPLVLAMLMTGNMDKKVISPLVLAMLMTGNSALPWEMKNKYIPMERKQTEEEKEYYLKRAEEKRKRKGWR